MADDIVGTLGDLKGAVMKIGQIASQTQDLLPKEFSDALKKLQKEVQNVGLTIIPLKLFLTDKGWAKLEIGLAKGKKLYDKRDTIKDRDNKRNLDRIKKNFK